MPPRVEILDKERDRLDRTEDADHLPLAARQVGLLAAT